MSLVKVVRDNYDAKSVSGSGWRLEPIEELANQEAALQQKLMEEVAEYLIDTTPEELCDIIEVVIGLAAHVHGLSFSALMTRTDEKRTKKGGYKRTLGLYLDQTFSFDRSETK